MNCTKPLVQVCGRQTPGSKLEQGKWKPSQNTLMLWRVGWKMNFILFQYMAMKQKFLNFIFHDHERHPASVNLRGGTESHQFLCKHCPASLPCSQPPHTPTGKATTLCCIWPTTRAPSFEFTGREITVAFLLNSESKVNPVNRGTQNVLYIHCFT